MWPSKEGIRDSQAAAYRYRGEAFDVLAAEAPALGDAKEQSLPNLILDGKVVVSGRCREKPPAERARARPTVLWQGLRARPGWYGGR
jgi:hypothetical protein